MRSDLSPEVLYKLDAVVMLGAMFLRYSSRQESNQDAVGGIMLYLVITTPLPGKPSEAQSDRQELWKWAAPLMDKGIIRDRCMYAKVGRGGMALFDVPSNEELHGYLSQWLGFVPAEMQVIPLMDSQAMRDYLASPTT